MLKNVETQFLKSEEQTNADTCKSLKILIRYLTKWTVNILMCDVIG